MRESIGTTWIFQLVIIFTLIFVSFLALSINYTRAFRMKNELVSIIEKYEGVGGEKGQAIFIINNYLLSNGYGIKSGCQKGEYGATSLTSTTLEEVVDNKANRYFYCVKPIPTITVAKRDQYRFHVTIFFKFSLPIIGDLMTFSIDGTTIDIVNANTTSLY